jgi:hypothetical protein
MGDCQSVRGPLDWTGILHKRASDRCAKVLGFDSEVG